MNCPFGTWLSSGGCFFKLTYTLTFQPIKPIFHQSANLVLVAHTEHDPQCEHFALPISYCWYVKKPRGSIMHPMRTPTNPIGHIIFFLFVSFFALCKGSFWWNMGFRFSQRVCRDILLKPHTHRPPGPKLNRTMGEAFE